MSDPTEPAGPSHPTKSDSGGSGRKPPRTAVGYSGSDDPKFHYGDKVECIVVAPEKHGYRVLIASSKTTTAFLISREHLTIGQKIVATVVSVTGGTLLLSFAPELELPWHLLAAEILPAPSDMTEVRDLTVKSPTEVESYIKTQRLTGCVKALTEDNRAASAMLLNHGKVIGCIYSEEGEENSLSTSEAIAPMLSDLNTIGTKVQIYPIDRAIVLSSGSLFIGYPVPRYPTLNSKEYVRYVLDWWAQMKQTGCLTVGSVSRVLGVCYVYEGLMRGAYCPPEQLFSFNTSKFDELICREDSEVTASVLPTGDAELFGIDLGEVTTQ